MINEKISKARSGRTRNDQRRTIKIAFGMPRGFFSPSCMMSGCTFEDDMLSLQMSESKRTVVGKTELVTRTRTDLISLLYIICDFPNRENRNSTLRFIDSSISSASAGSPRYEYFFFYFNSLARQIGDRLSCAGQTGIED